MERVSGHNDLAACRSALSERFTRLVVLVVISLGCLTTVVTANQQLNVLFIAADDLRCDLACYGHPLAKTPHLDRLASKAVLFERAYCQQAVCNPSRASLLTGLRPDTLRLWNLTKHFRDEKPNIVTLPQHFKNHGYFTQNIGKIFHNWRTAIQGDPASWSVPAVMHFARHGDDQPQLRPVEGEQQKTTGSLPRNWAHDARCECRDVPDTAYFDGRIAELAVEAIRDRKAAGDPFFLAVGFWKPHSPFNAPKRYWDWYDRQDISPPHNPDWPENAPRIAWHNSREILGSPAKKLSAAEVREIRHGYLAAVSYLDAQIGNVLAELERQDLSDNTIVVFWSDHGYHLGEQTLWAKTSNFELDARVPLMIAVPRSASLTTGTRTQSLVELLDLYPTLVELCELPAVEHLQGSSLVPVLRNPSASIHKAVLTQHPRPAYFDNIIEAMGYSLRTDRYRYTEWRDPATNAVVARELYDLSRRIDEVENIVHTRQMATLRPQLAAQLDQLISQP